MILVQKLKSTIGVMFKMLSSLIKITIDFERLIWLILLNRHNRPF